VAFELKSCSAKILDGKTKPKRRLSQVALMPSELTILEIGLLECCYIFLGLKQFSVKLEAWNFPF
jgi:hypothetical protein